MTSADVYRDVHRHRELAPSWAWKGAPERGSLAPLTLRSAGNGTESNMLHVQFFDVEARHAHDFGRTSCMVRFGAFVEQRSA